MGGRFEDIKRPQRVLGALVAWGLRWFDFAVPLAFALTVYFAGDWLRATSVGGARATSWSSGALWSLVVLACLYFVLLTRGTREILGPELLSSAFDSLAQSLLRGSAEVDPAAIRWEAFVVEGRAYMYFGPWPALLRVPMQWLASDLAGQWARLSCFAASMLAVAGFSLLVLRMLAKNIVLDESESRFLLLTSIMGFGLATPLFFLMNAASIYHESILWGLAGSLCFLAVLVPRLDEPDALVSKLPLLATLAGATLLARVTYGGPLFLVLLLISLRACLRGGNMGKIFIALLPAGLMLLLQLWYNFDRFGSPWTFVDYRLMDFMRADSSTLDILDRTGNFSLGRVFVALANYFGLSAELFSGRFPWFKLAAPWYPDANLYPRIFTSWVMPLSLMSSWLVLGGLAGWARLLADRTRGFAQLCLGAFILQILLVCAYYIMELRYEIDLLPAFVFGYACFVSHAGMSRLWRGRVQDLLTLMLFAVALSALVSMSTTLSAIPVGGPAHPNAYKAEWQQRFDAFNAALPGGR